MNFFLAKEKNSKLFFINKKKNKKKNRRNGALTLRMDGVAGGRRLSWAESYS